MSIRKWWFNGPGMRAVLLSVSAAFVAMVLPYKDRYNLFDCAS